MPRDVLGTLGNSHETRVKQKHFREIIRPHMRIVKGISERSGTPSFRYLYADMNAGCGWYSDHQGSYFVGSPIAAIEEATDVGVDLEALLFESSTPSARWLDVAVKKSNRKCFPVSIINADHRLCVTDLLVAKSQQGRTYGLIYNDPSGTDPSFDVLSEISLLPQFRFMDILIYCSATNIKRKIKSNPSKYSQRLSDGMGKIGKKHWIIRKPRGAHQWTFLIGTNWTRFPVFRGLGFVPVDSSEGKLVLDSLDLTKEEFRTKHCGTQMSIRDYSDYLSSHEFKQVRAVTMSRAKGVCELCLSRKASEVHHMKYEPWGVLDSPDNLKAICHPCHCLVHGKEK